MQNTFCHKKVLTLLEIALASHRNIFPEVVFINPTRVGTFTVLRGVFCDISLILHLEKTKHTTTINVKLSTQEWIFNYKQMDLKI